MAKKCISYSTIFKRLTSLNIPVITESQSEIIGTERYLNNLKLQLEKISDGNITPSLKNSLRSFIESICNISNANKYYREPLYLMETFNDIDHRISNEILADYTTRILPYVENLSNMNETVNRYKLTESQKEKILEVSYSFTIADRILKNHDKISKRFNIESEILKTRSKGLKSIIESCCTMIDTYTIESYQKLNLCIEELTYLFNKNHIDYEPKDLASIVTEYFILSSPTLSDSDIRGYRKALEGSYCLMEEDLEDVKYIFRNRDEINTDNSSTTSIKKEIENFLLSANKSVVDLEANYNRALSNTSKLDIVTNYHKFIWLIWDIQKSGICDQEEWFDMNTEGFFDRLVRLIEDGISLNNMIFNKDDISTLMTNIDKVKSVINSNVDDDYEYTCLVSRFKSNIDKLQEKLKVLLNLVYTETNLESINFVNNNEIEPMPLHEFKLFKFNNLVKAAINIDRYLALKAKKIYNKGQNKIRSTIRRVKNILFGESVNDIYSYIGEDGKVDFCVAQFYIDEGNIEEIHEFFDNTCKEYNHQLNIDGNFTSKAYYIINPGVVEVHLKESTPILLEENDYKLIKESDFDDLDVYIEEFASLQAVIESYEEFCSKYTLESIQDKLTRFVDNKDLDMIHYQVAMEALSLLNTSKEDIEIFTEKFSNYRYSTAVLESVINDFQYNRELNIMKEISNNWIHEDCVPLYIQWEAYQILCAVLEDTKKPEEKKMSPEEEREFKKNPFKGININSIKLYLEGLKSKMKNMSQKEKEISSNLDNNFRRFVKAMKDALISDRREAIIKGSVIPSFSKCIKIGIGLAGIGFISGNPLVPIIIAIGGFAMSKRLTKRERLLLLDEIETELEVLDKEISIAESKNQIKKFRALLKYKKDLQRQYQRIKYNINIGKDILPNSTAGIKKFDN